MVTLLPFHTPSADQTDEVRMSSQTMPSSEKFISIEGIARR
ncbi:MAG: ABC transporter ATP-binding protein, partial [Alphaproteobacteria bacterium]